MPPIDSAPRVVVTAGAAGIGLAIAARFLEDGCRVFVCDMSESAIDNALQEYPGLDGSVADVGDPESVEKFFEKVLRKAGGIDVLVNNAGIAGPTANAEDIDYQDWDDVIRVNLSGMFYCSKQVIPAMKLQKRGSIINISTCSSESGLPRRLAYVASKTGVNGMTHALARELGPYNIRCNAILPGLVDTDRVRNIIQMKADADGTDPDAVLEEFLEYISMRSMVTPGEVADMAAFLASEDARHVTNQHIGVCGNIEWEI